MRTTILCTIAVLVCSACDMVQVYQGQIDQGSRAIATAKDDAARATAYAARGRAYSNKARLAVVRKQIDRGEYVRLFDLAIADHDHAVGLASANAELYLQRGLTYYDRAVWVMDVVDADRTPWFDAARADFSTAVQKDPSQTTAHDYLGMVNEQTDRMDEAIGNYTHVLALDPRLGKMRLAELHCNRGQARLREKDYDLAAAELEESVGFASRADGCSCEPYNPLAYIYIDATGQYDKGWDLVRRARESGHRIAREYVERLEKASPRRG